MIDLSGPRYRGVLDFSSVRKFASSRHDTEGLLLSRRRSVDAAIRISSPTRHIDPEDGLRPHRRGLMRRAAGVAPFRHVVRQYPWKWPRDRNAVAGSPSRRSGLAAWIVQNVAFPNSMVDALRPRPQIGKCALPMDWLDDNWPVFAKRSGSGFRGQVRGPPALEKVGVTFTSDVAPTS